MRNLNLSILRITALLLGAVLFGFAPPHAVASGGTYFVDGNKGNDSNPGSAAQPWRTLKKATASIQPGDTVIFARGIYRVSGVLLLFSPDGLDANHPTTFKAAAGARVIFTGTGDEPVNVKVGDTRGGAYVRIEGLWFGGKWDRVNDHSVDVSGIPIGEGIQVVNCTIFGYKSGLISGATENLLVQGDRFIHNGDGGLNHAIYLSGSDGSGSAQTNHLIIDHNLIFDGQGYGIHAWHRVHDAILTRNFVAGQYWGSVLDGSDHLEANNFFWKELGSSRVIPWGPWVPGTSIIFMNNIIGPIAWLQAGTAQAQANTFENNAFASWSVAPGSPLVYAPRGTNKVILKHGQESKQFGISETTLDQTIAALDKSFSQPVAAIYKDTTIEANFAKLQFKTPATSPLYQTGYPWFGQGLNIGTDTAVPGSTDGFWSAFYALGLKNWDRFGNVH